MSGQGGIHIATTPDGTHCGAPRASLVDGRPQWATWACRFVDGTVPWSEVCPDCLEGLNSARRQGGLGPVQDTPRGLSLEEAKAYWRGKL